ncbi:Protein of unknown function (DUF2800) [Leptolyngbya sp. PCC 7375]|nr:Protein of unknown function (DUF2800) [Leptolyngbya sp. PCC 7375]
MTFPIPDDVLTGEHALFSPSAAKRWMSCPASVYRSMGKKDVATKPAQVGTAAHWVLEWALTFDMDAIEFVGSDAPNGISIDTEMCGHVQMAIDWVREQIADGSELIVESKVDIYKALNIRDNDGYLPVIYGTVDIRIIHPDGTLTVADYKHGVWGVSVKKNPQLELYSFGALHELDHIPDKIRLVIIQPRNGGIKTLEMDTSDLLSNELMYWHSVYRGLEQDAPAFPSSESCHFCLAKHSCAENWEFRNAELLELAKEFSE